MPFSHECLNCGTPCHFRYCSQACLDEHAAAKAAKDKTAADLLLAKDLETAGQSGECYP